VFLTSILDGGEWSASCSDHFNPGVTAPGTDLIGARCAAELVWMQWQREKYPCPCQQLNPGHPVSSSVTILSKLSWVHEHASPFPMAKTKKPLPCSCWKLSLSHPSHSLVTILTEILWLQKYKLTFSNHKSCSILN
jgi:hypothetical protein